MTTHQQEDFLFDEDPETNLRIENEVLRLKLQAEQGALIYTDDDLPPELEAEFLSHVQEFEQAWQQANKKKLYLLIGQPLFIPEENLNDQQLDAALQHILEILEENAMSVDMPEGTDPRTLYSFITEYLFEQEVEDMQVEGLRRHFIFNEDYSENDEAYPEH